VAEAIQSVLNQTYRNFEIIVVDDGSTDNTREILAGFGDKIKVICQENKGVSAARNAGIAAARGDWVAFLDSDDLWLPDKLKIQVQDLSKYPQAIAHAVDAKIQGYGEYDTTLFTLRGCVLEFRDKALRERPLLEVLNVQFFTPTLVVSRRVLLLEGGFKEAYKIYEDLELVSRVAIKGPFVVNTYVGVIVRRVGTPEASLSHQHVRDRCTSPLVVCQILSGLLDRDELTHSERACVRRKLSGARFQLSEAMRSAGRYREARSLRWQSLYDWPSPKAITRAILGELGLGGVWWRMRTCMAGTREFRRSELDATRAGRKET